MCSAHGGYRTSTVFFDTYQRHLFWSPVSSRKGGRTEKKIMESIIL